MKNPQDEEARKDLALMRSVLDDALRLLEAALYNKNKYPLPYPPTPPHLSYSTSTLSLFFPLLVDPPPCHAF